jgi:hypothetical protein
MRSSDAGAGRESRSDGSIVLCLIVLGVTAAASGSAAAQESFPRVEGDVRIEVQNDGIYRSEASNGERDDLFTKTEAEPRLRLTPELSLAGHLTLDTIDKAPTESRAFEDEGLFVEELYLAYDTERWGLLAGKFNVNFGIAQREAPGIYGNDFALAGYDFTERVGLGGRLSGDLGPAGRVDLSASTFFLDTSVLSESLLADRGRTRLEDGGPSNTEDLSSFAVALDGEQIPGLPGLAWHAAFIRQAPGETEGEDERGVALALYGRWPGPGGTEIAPVIEGVRFEDADGVAGRERSFLTTGAELASGPWSLALVHNLRRTSDEAQGTDDDQLVQVSVGYQFDFGLEAHVGWRWAREDGDESETLGVLLAYGFSF